MVAGEAIAAGGADLAVVVDLLNAGGRVDLRSNGGQVGATRIEAERIDAAGFDTSEADRTTL